MITTLFLRYGCDLMDRDQSYITIYNKLRESEEKKVFRGTMTHFGKGGEIIEGDPLEEGYMAGKSVPIGGERDVVGAHEHSQYGGWYYWSANGAPKHLRHDRFEITVGTTLILATSFPPVST